MRVRCFGAHVRAFEWWGGRCSLTGLSERSGGSVLRRYPDPMEPSITDWLSSIGSFGGFLVALGALWVAFLSYQKSSRALKADGETRDAVGSTLDAVEAFGTAGTFDAVLDEALKRRADAETHEHVWEDGYLVSREREHGQEKRDAYEKALAAARRKLGRFPLDDRFPVDDRFPGIDEDR